MIKTLCCLFSLATVVSAEIVELGPPYENAIKEYQANPSRSILNENFNYLHDSPIKSFELRKDIENDINTKVELIWFDGSREGRGTDEGSFRWYAELEEGDCFTSH